MGYLVASTTTFVEDSKMWTSLTKCEQQRDPKWYFILNPYVQFDQEMINCGIFGEFLQDGEGAIGHHYKSLYLCIHTSIWSEKNYTSKSWWYVSTEKKNRALRALLSILISTFWF